MSQLEDLLQECTVKLTIPGQMGWGTGFFVATGWILTCGHVVKQAGGQPVQVRWQQQENWAQAVVEKLLPEPYDVALLRVTLPLGANPPCVYLDEGVESRDPLYLFGYPDKGDRQGEPRTFNCDGRTGGEIPAILFKLGQVRPGMSGSPLLNQRTRKVCGMVKFTRDRSFDLGGGAIPTSVILEQLPELRELQREFHGSDRRWANLITPPGIDFQPYLRSLITNEKYQQKWGFYTPTDAVGKIQQPRAASELDIGLMMQLMQPQKAEGDGTPRQEEKTERLPVLEGIRKYAADHVLLMGRPGSGKSTALLSLLVETANQALADPSASIPVLVELRYLDADRPSVLERIGAFLQSHTLSVEEATLKALLAEGKLLLLIDGVNELPSESARRTVARFRQDYAKTPMIFTTRDMAIGGDVGIEKKLEMQPLNELQMQQFVQAYLPEQGEPMLRQLQGRLREVGQPLLLWMLCHVFQGLQQIPTSLGLLFRWFAGEYDKLKRDVPVSEGLRHWQTDLLQQLAFTMMQAEEPTELRVAIPRPEAETTLAEFLQGKVDYPAQRAKEWLEDLLEHHLIQPTSQNQLEFHHQLLQEYYAAEYLLKLLPTLTDDQLKREYLNYLKWTEPVALMLEFVENEVISVGIVEQALDVNLMLGARLVKELPLPTNTNITALEHEILREMISGSGQLKRPRHKIDLIARQHLPKRLKEKLLDSTLTCPTEDISSYSDFEEIDAEQNVNDLVSILETTGDPVDFLMTVGNLGRLRSEKAIPTMLKFLKIEDLNFQWAIKEALIQISGDRVGSALIEIFQDGRSNLNLRALVAEILGRIGYQSAIPALLLATRYEDSRIRSASIEALGEIVSVIRVRDKNRQLSPTQVLGEVVCHQCINAIRYGLSDREVHVQWSARLALAKFGIKDESLSKMIEVLEGVEYLTELHESEEYYHELKEGEDWIYHDEVSWSAAEALSHLDASILPELRKSLFSHSNIHTPHLEALLHAIAAIQNCCKYYNYEIFQVHQSAQKADRQTHPNSDPGTTIHIAGDYIAGDKIQGDKTAGNKAENQFPNATEVKIFENVQAYHTSTPSDSSP